MDGALSLDFEVKKMRWEQVECSIDQKVDLTAEKTTNQREDKRMQARKWFVFECSADMEAIVTVVQEIFGI